MRKKPPSDDLDAQQKYWYSRLKKEGFVDIEDQSRAELKTFEATYLYSIHSKDVDHFFSKQQYYRLAGQFLFDYPFKNLIHREIWKQHAEGQTIRQIADELKKRGFKSYKEKIHKIIKHFSEIMMNGSY